MSWRDLTATASLAQGGTLALVGEASADDLGALLAAAGTALPPGVAEQVAALRPQVTGAALAWSADAGWLGQLQATAELPWLPALPDLRVSARADDGALLLTATGEPLDGSARLEARLQSGPWSTAALSGRLEVDLPASALLPDLGLPVRVSSEATVGGTVTSPVASGTLSVQGAVAAEGEYAYRDGVGSLRATGPHLTLAGELSERGAFAELHVDELALDAWVPQLPEGRLSLAASYAGSQVTVESVALEAPRSTVTGRGTATLGDGATPGPRYRLALDAAVNLADLDLGDVQLTGTVRGPLVIGAGSGADLSTSTVVANLAALNVGTSALDWSVSGNLTVGGTVADPVIATQLVGDGELRGGLTATARPQRREYALTSTLGTGQLATDLRVDIGNGATSAAGTVRVGDGLLLVSTDEPTDEPTDLPPGAAPADLVITGAGRFAGLAARLHGDLSALELSGDLNGLSSGLEGQVELTVDSRAGAWLQGGVSGLTVSGFQLAPMTIESAALGAPITLESADLHATFDPATMEWTVAAQDVRLGEGAAAGVISLSGAGQGATGQLDASAQLPEVQLELQVTHEEGTEVQLTGQVYGGQLLVSGERSPSSGEWNGSGDLTGAALAGFDVSAQITLLGVGALPTAVLNTSAVNGLTITGNASVGMDGVTVDQLVSGPPLAQSLRMQGSVLPRTELTLSTLDLGGVRPTSAAAAARATTSSVRLVSAPGTTPADPPRLLASGTLSVPVGPARVELSGADTAPELALTLAGLPRLRAEGQLQATDLLDLVTRVSTGGLELEGREDAHGRLRLDPTGPYLELNGFGLEFAGVRLDATGTVGLTEADVVGQVVVRTDLPVAERQTGYVFPWTLSNDREVWRLVSQGQHGEFSVVYGADGTAILSLAANLQLSEGRIEGRLGLQPEGPAGSLSVSSIRLLSPEFGPVSVNVQASVADGRIGGNATLDGAAGSAILTGSWGLGGLLPAALVPEAPSGGRLEARVRALELSEVPFLQEHVPELHGQLAGSAQLRDGFLFGQVVAPEIGVADLTTPLQLSFSGRPDDISLEAQLRGALGRASLTRGNLSGMFRLERFPLTLVSTAVVGPADFTADLTGVMRFDGPLASPRDGYLRLATEEVRLERMGVTTLGNVTVTYDQQALLVERAEFAGLGSWRAEGELRRENFDFRLEATEADFTPLLGLAPQLARLGVGAVGSFDLSVLGDASDPSIQLLSPDLRVDVAGTSYRLRNTELELDGVTLSVASQVEGLRPITGNLDVAGNALLSLNPFAIGSTNLRFAGAADLSTFGRMTDIQGAIQQQPDGTPTVELVGRMGEQPLTVEGTLAPLAIRATGSGVAMRLPSLLVDQAVVDADIQLVQEQGGVALSGNIVADEVIVDPAARREARTDDRTDEAPPEEAEVEAIPSVETPPPPQAAAPQRQGGMQALRFDDLSIRAPGRVTLTTNIGSFEAALDLQLSGTGAEPRLAGTASAIRGNIRFGGRDFTIDRAVATFAPNRGVYPELDVAAHAEFDKQRVVSAAPNVDFAAPREGGTFEVQLAFFGPVEPTDDGGFRFDIEPLLTSNAIIEVRSQGTGGSATRPFTEAELMALVTLGRFELNADLIGAGGLGEAVASGALDTAVDLLVLSGLETALREALGFDVVEIRTTSLSSLIDDGAQPFGVSLRVGGYLNPELFASYRIGTYDGADPEFSITNEVLLRYGLGPLDLDIIGRIDLPAAGVPGQARPEIGAVLGYQFSPWLGIAAGITVGPARSQLEFGVTIRW